ncbi:MAG: hypothetical protein JNM57_02870 [Cyclobacteriaceae bacterium]|nr:hypothetical protein [Cyclobacteriaceae bacterium]
METTQPIKYDRLSLLSLAILIILTWGFYRTYIMFFPSFEGFQFIQHFHGVIMLLWMIMLIVQPLLIARKKNQLHKTIGKISYVIAPLLMVSIFLVSRLTYHKNLEALPTLQDAVAGIALSIPSLFIFGALYGLAVTNTRRTYYHMRYMIGTALLMIGPGLGRGLIIYFGIPFPVAVSITLGAIALIGIAFFIADSIKKKDYKPNLNVVILLVIQSLVWEIRYTAVWQSTGEVFAKWFF